MKALERIKETIRKLEDEPRSAREETSKLREKLVVDTMRTQHQASGN